MTEPLELSTTVAGLRKRIAVFWAKAVARVPVRARMVAEGRPGEGAAALEHDLHAFAIVQPAETAAAFGVLAPTWAPAVAAEEATKGHDAAMGLRAISLANVGNVLDCLGLAVEP